MGENKDWEMINNTGSIRYTRSYWANGSVFQHVSEGLMKYLSGTQQKNSNSLLTFVCFVLLSSTFHLNIIMFECIIFALLPNG